MKNIKNVYEMMDFFDECWKKTGYQQVDDAIRNALRVSMNAILYHALQRMQKGEDGFSVIYSMISYGDQTKEEGSDGAGD